MDEREMEEGEEGEGEKVMTHPRHDITASHSRHHTSFLLLLAHHTHTLIIMETVTVIRGHTHIADSSASDSTTTTTTVDPLPLRPYPIGSPLWTWI